MGVLSVAYGRRPGVLELPVGCALTRDGAAGNSLLALGCVAGTGPWRALAWGRLAAAVARIPAHVSLGDGEAHQRRPGLAVVDRAQLSLRDPAAASVDELVHAPVASMVPD